MRFGLLGTGHWAATVHGPGLASHPGVELVGVWGRDAARAGAVAGGLGTATFGDVDDLIGASDAVAVALPPDVQAGLAARAARAGRHLLLEKPLALDLPAGEEVVAAVDQARVASVTFFTARFSPGLADWHRQLARGGWEAALWVELGSIFEPDSPYAGSAWRRSWGALWDIGPHALASLTVGLGPVEAVTATHGARDLVALSTAHAGGGTASVLLALDAPPAALDRRATFYGERGVLNRPEDPTTVADAYRSAVDALLATAGAGRTDHPCDVGFAYDVLRVLVAAARAAGRAD
ncbi:MAG: Gfo/Idh/MocA family protein [Acidimicrobiales bacterium]